MPKLKAVKLWISDGSIWRKCPPECAAHKNKLSGKFCQMNRNNRKLFCNYRFKRFFKNLADSALLPKLKGVKVNGQFSSNVRISNENFAENGRVS
jgi:hypothetical protein